MIEYTKTEDGYTAILDDWRVVRITNRAPGYIWTTPLARWCIQIDGRYLPRQTRTLAQAQSYVASLVSA